MGERLHGMQEVTGSIPVSSTANRLFFPCAMNAGIGDAETDAETPRARIGR